jgi:hypothetical protein
LLLLLLFFKFIIGYKIYISAEFLSLSLSLIRYRRLLLPQQRCVRFSGSVWFWRFLKKNNFLFLQPNLSLLLSLCCVCLCVVFSSVARHCRRLFLSSRKKILRIWKLNYIPWLSFRCGWQHLRSSLLWMCIFLQGSQRARSGLVNDRCCIPVKYTLIVVLLGTFFLSRVLGGLLVTHHRLWWADWHYKAISALPYLFPILCLSSRSLNTGSKSHGCLFPPPIVRTPSLGSNPTTVPYGNKWRRRRCLHGTMSPSLLFTYCFQDIDLNCTSSSLKPHKVVSPVVCHCTALSSTTTKSELWAIHRQLRDFHLLRKKDLNMNSVCCFLFCEKLPVQSYAQQIQSWSGPNILSPYIRYFGCMQGSYDISYTTA